MVKELNSQNFPFILPSVFYCGYPMPDCILDESTNVEDLMIVGSLSISVDEFCLSLEKGECSDLQVIESKNGCNWQLVSFERFSQSFNTVHPEIVVLYYEPIR